MKEYILTSDEIMVIKNALIEYHQKIKGLSPRSPIAQRNQALTSVLKEQFTEDYANTA